MIIIGSTQKHAKIDYDGICPCLTSAMGQGGGQIPMFTEEKMNNLRIRKLTPKECWRLMGFDDSDFEKAEKVNSNTQLYKQAGNSIVVNVLEKILENLIDKEEHIRILELFGGIGACSKALERLGIDYEIADYVEIDKYAVKSFNAMHGTNFEPQDICKWNKDIECDLIMHGSPCQDFSLAGKQAGGDEGSGTRSSLMYETVRIVEKLKPKYVIWENVKNVISKKHKHNFDNYLNKMDELGYKNYWQVLNAKDYGIPQNRERVFTISVLNGNNYKFPDGADNKNKINRLFNFSARQDCRVVYDENGLCPTLVAGMGEGGGKVPMFIDKGFNFPPKQELKLKLKDMLEDNVDEKYYLTDSMIQYLEYGKYNASKVSSKLKQTETGICPTLDTMQGGNRQPFIKVKNATKQGYLEATEGDGIDISSRMQYHRGNVQKDSIQTITTSGGNDRGVVVRDKIDLSCLD